MDHQRPFRNQVLCEEMRPSWESIIRGKRADKGTEPVVVEKGPGKCTTNEQLEEADVDKSLYRGPNFSRVEVLKNGPWATDGIALIFIPFLGFANCRERTRFTGIEICGWCIIDSSLVNPLIQARKVIPQFLGDNSIAAKKNHYDAHHIFFHE